MKQPKSPYMTLLWGVLALAAGVLILLFNHGVFDPWRPTVEWVVSGVIAVGGVGFLANYLIHREQWWQLIPGCTLLSLAGAVYLSTNPDVGGELPAALLFLGIAVAFVLVYVADRRNWWAIIPGGILLVLAGVVAVSTRVSAETLGSLLFLGLGVVFFLVYVLGQRKREVWWSLIPGGILVTFGLFLFALTGGREVSALQWWPTLLILAGAVFLVQTWLRLRQASVPSGSDSKVEIIPPQEKSGAASVDELDEEEVEDTQPPTYVQLPDGSKTAYQGSDPGESPSNEETEGETKDRG